MLGLYKFHRNNQVLRHFFNIRAALRYRTGRSGYGFV